jgi:hypothetical protein
MLTTASSDQGAGRRLNLVILCQMRDTNERLTNVGFQIDGLPYMV